MATDDDNRVYKCYQPTYMFYLCYAIVYYLHAMLCKLRIQALMHRRPGDGGVETCVLIPHVLERLGEALSS